MRKILVLTMLASAVRLFAADVDNMLILQNFKLPKYHDDGRPHFIVYGQEAELAGVMVELTGVKIDLVNDDVSKVEQIIDLGGVVLYRIDAPQAEVDAFWRDKPHCKAIISTSRASYDRTSNIVRGDEIVHLRTRLMDIDGVGFDADYQAQKIHIRDKVKVIVRNHKLPDGMMPGLSADDNPAATAAAATDMSGTKNKTSETK